MILSGLLSKNKRKKTEKSAIAPESPLSAKIFIMSFQGHLFVQSATVSAKRHRETSA